MAGASQAPMTCGRAWVWVIPSSHHHRVLEADSTAQAQLVQGEEGADGRADGSPAFQRHVLESCMLLLSWRSSSPALYLQ